MFKEITIKFQDKEQTILAEVIDRKVWFKLDQQVYSFDVIELSARQGKAGQNQKRSQDKILAPMPGKVTKIFVKEGQLVQKGQALLVMEAMKMEYTLKSDLSATVEKLNTQLNEQVNLGHLLIQLKPESAS